MIFSPEIIAPPSALPVQVNDADKALAAAVVEEIERVVLWRAVVNQERRILIDGPLPFIIEIEPTTSIVSLTRWTPTDAAAVVDPASYSVVSRDPAGTIIEPRAGYDWPAPERTIGSFALTYACGWIVTPESTPGAGDAVNGVPASVRLMVERAISFRMGSSGLTALKVGSTIDLPITRTYQTDRLPREIQSIGRAYQFRPGVIAARPPHTRG